MSLLAPLALLGLLTLPLILLLHFLRNRREQLPISSLRLWRGLQQKRQGARPRSIPLSLLLLLQLLAACALTFGLARPVFSFLRFRPQQTIFILDTTTSMLAEDASPLAGNSSASLTTSTRFEAARQTIRAAVEGMNSSDTVIVISLNRRPEVLLANRGTEQAQALLALDNLVAGNTGLNLAAALTLANGLLDPDQDRRLIVLTDSNNAIENESLPPALAPVEWRTFGAGPSTANQALLNVSVRTLPDKRHRLFARVINYSSQPAERTLQVMADDRRFDETTLQLEAEAEIARVWTLPASVESVVVEIVEPDPLPVDNRAELLLTNSSRYRVLLLSENAEPGSEALRRALQAQPGVELTIDAAANRRNYDPGDFDLLVFDGLPAEQTTWPAGNLLVLNPPLGHPLLPAQNFARNLRPNLDSASALLNGVDLSGVYFNRLPALELPAWAEVDLWTVAQPDDPAGGSNGYPLIFNGAVDNSRIVVWAFNLNESNLPARLALPLLTANTFATLISAETPPVVALGEPAAVGPGLTVEDPAGRRLTPAAQVTAGQINQFVHTRQPGIYRIYNRNNQLVRGFAVQAGSAFESNLMVSTQPAIPAQPGHTLATEEFDYQEYWPWLAGLALAVITLEGWLAWRK